MLHRFAGLTAGLALALCLSSAAEAARRIALVIGNDAYQSLPRLHKAIGDARAYAALLERQGFDHVMLHTDLTRKGMDEAMSAFVERIEPGDTALFAYSGHGWSDGVQNFLVGVDVPRSGSPDLLARMSLPLRNGVNGVLDDVERRGAGLKVAIIDACRDNPFQSTVAGRNVGLGRGLSRIDPPKGTFVVFSAGTGQVALDRLSPDDPNPNSVFTRTFIPLLQAGLPLQEAMQRARVQVVALARDVRHEQQPAYYDELLGPACLAGTCTVAAPEDKPIPEKTAEPGPPPVTAPSSDRVAWDGVRDSASIAMLKEFVARYPASPYAGFAAVRIKEIEEHDGTRRAREEEQRRLELQRQARAAEEEAARARADRELQEESRRLQAERERLEEVRRAQAERERIARLPDRSIDVPPPASRGWFVILGSFPQSERGKANQRLSFVRSRGQTGARIIDTSEYEGLTPGLFAVVLGPYSRAEALRRRDGVSGLIGDAYVREASNQ